MLDVCESCYVSGVRACEQPISDFWMRPTIPPEASNIKLWLPVDSLYLTGTWLSTEFTPLLAKKVVKIQMGIKF